MRSQGTTTLIKCVIFFSYNVVYSCVWSHYTSTHRGCISFFKDKKKKRKEILCAITNEELLQFNL